MNSLTQSLDKARPLAALTVMALVLFGANLWGYDLWPADEPRFGEIAREMLETGDWLVLRVNGEPYLEKPPLLFWAIAAVSAPFGEVSASTARAPSLLAAVAAVIATYLLTARLLGRRCAFWAAVVLCTNVRFWWQARTAQTDMLLAASLAIAMFALWMHHEKRTTGWLWAFYAAVTAAVYAKGPVGVLIPALTIAPFYWRRTEARRSLHWVLGLLIVAALIALWLVPARMAASRELAASAHTAIGSNLFRQTIGRFFLGVSKAEPPWHYAKTLPVDLLPWTLFLPWTAVWAWKRRKQEGVRFLLCWILPALLFFTLCAGKRGLYLLPLLPAFAALTAATVLDLVDRERVGALRTAGGIWAVAVALAGMSVHVIRHTEYEHVWTPWLIPISVAALVLAADLLVHVVLGRAWGVHGRMAASFGLMALLVAFGALPVVNQFKSARDFCSPLRELSRADVPYRLYSLLFSREEFIFYAEHFHEPVLVDEFPHVEAPGVPQEDLNRGLALAGQALQKAANAVVLTDPCVPSEDELKEIRAKMDMAFSLAGNEEAAHAIREGLSNALDDFAREFESDEPAFLFVQSRDWPWLAALCPPMRRWLVVSGESVGRRELLLVANGAGARLLESRRVLCARLL